MILFNKTRGTMNVNYRQRPGGWVPSKNQKIHFFLLAGWSIWPNFEENKLFFGKFHTLQKPINKSFMLM